MNASRIRLSRIIAFNWYGFRTIIEVNGLTLLCGETGTGKSALLDLIQFVMSANAAKFNKAAAGETNARDLCGYCLCNTNTRHEGKPRYLRRSGSTIAALEFTWPGQDGQVVRKETWGIRVQYESPNVQPTYVRFWVPARLEREDFCDEQGNLLSEELFRSRVKRELSGDAGFTTHKAFQEEMAVARHLHFDPVQMRKTLPKAMAFELDYDYQRFIREFILEASPPDIANTRRSLDALRQAEVRVKQLYDQQQRLGKIAEHHQAFAQAYHEAALFGHLRYAFDHEEAKQTCEDKERNLTALRTKHAENQTSMERAVAASDDAQRQLDAVKFIAGKEIPELGAVARLTQETNDLTKEVDELTAVSKRCREYLFEKSSAWNQWLRHASSIGIEAQVDANLLRGLQEAETSNALDAVGRLIGSFHLIKERANAYLEPIRNEITSLEKNVAQLERQLQQLKSGRTSATPLLDVLLRNGMKAQTLGREVEIAETHEGWWGIIETLLEADREAVLVGTKADFIQAKDHWQRLPKPEPLIHPEEIPAAAVLPGALSTFLETNHPIARKFLDWRLGKIIGVTTVAMLEEHPQAITQDGVMKSFALRQKLTPAKEFTLGTKGLERLRAAKQIEFEDATKHLNELKLRRDDIHQWIRRGMDAQLDQDHPPQRASEIRHLEERRTRLNQSRSNLDLIATPDVKKRLAQIKTLEQRLASANQRIGELKPFITDFQIKEAKQMDELASAQLEFRDCGIFLHESRVKLPASINDREIATRLAEAMATPLSWKARRAQVEEGRSASQGRAQAAKDQRSLARRALLEAHGDEYSEFDAQDDDNQRYDQRLGEVQEHEIHRFEALATERRADWEARLQEDILNRLSQQLKEAGRTIGDFRRVLGQQIGNYRYVLSQTRDPLHRAMWKLIDQSAEGLQPGDALHDWKLQEEMKRAKEDLMHALDHPEDKRGSTLLDYRNYHRYDLEMIPAGHADNTEGRISLQEFGQNLSGGEGQVPFFVAMLAAFQRVYDRGPRNQLPNLGFVVMDEAFSKLSAGHIADCLTLAEAFGLQLILAFPMDRLGTMEQHADSIIQCRIEKRSDSKGVPTEIINDVIYYTREQFSQVLQA